MSRDGWYKEKLLKESSIAVRTMQSREIRCNVCGHKLLMAYEDSVKGHIRSYCNKCHDYRIIDFSESSEEKDSGPPPKIEDLPERDIRCPVCGHKMLIAYMDSDAGHIKSYCNRCHEYIVIDFHRFRSGKKN